MTPSHFSSILSTATFHFFGVALNPSTWRHASIAIFKEYNIRQISEGGDAASDLQAVHSTRTAEEHYALSMDSILTLGDSTFVLFFATSTDWQTLMGYAAPPKAPEQMEKDDWEWIHHKARQGMESGNQSGLKAMEIRMEAIEKKQDELKELLQTVLGVVQGGGHTGK